MTKRKTAPPVEPKPVPYDLDKAVRELDATAPPPFEFKYKRKKWSLTSPDRLDIRDLLDDRDLSALDQFIILLGPEQWEVFPHIHAPATEALIGAYAAHLEEAEGATLEKEPPSDD